MAAELPSPGVDIFQNFQRARPTPLPATLPAVVVGVAKQTVNVVNRTATGAAELNDQSQISLPASVAMKAATGSPIAYTGLDGLDLVLSIRGAEDITLTFAGNSLSPASMAAQVNDMLLQLNVGDAIAEVYGDDQWRLVTIGKGPFESIEIRPGTAAQVLSAFELIIGYVYTGATEYRQSDLTVPLPDFPDPNGNLDEIAVEPATVRAFLRPSAGLNLIELSRTEAFLRRGGGGAAAALVGTVSAGTGGLYGGGGTLTTTTLTVVLDGALPVNIVLAAPADAGAVRDQVNAVMGFPFMNYGSTFEVASPTRGLLSNITLTGTAAPLLGFTAPNNTSTGTLGVAAVSVGTGQLTDTVKVLGQNFTTAGSAAVAVGAYDITGISYPADLLNKTLQLEVDGRGVQTLTFGSLGNQAALLAAINAFYPGLTATVASTKLNLTTTELGTDAAVRIVGGTACPVLGLVPSVLGRHDLGTIDADLTTLNGKKLRFQAPDGTVEITFSGLTGSLPATVATFLNGTPAFAAVAKATIDSAALRISGLKGGEDLAVPHTLTILAATSADAAPYLGLSRYDSATFQLFEGGPNPPMANDDLYLDGALLGRIIKVAPNGETDRLRIDKRLSVRADQGNMFHIRGRQLTAGLASRPDPELVVSGSGRPSLKQSLLRDTSGVPMLGQAAVHLAYRAVRLDLSARAKTPGLLSVGSTLELSDIMPATADNPLGLGLYLALLNASGATVNGLGIDAVTEDAPYGTVEAFTRAAEFLEAYDIYAIAPLTNDAVVGQVFSSHVTEMSLPESRSERMVIFNHAQPTRRLDKVVASGTDGNSVGSLGTQFDTGISNLSSLVQNAGVNPVGTIPASAGIFLDIATDGKRYNIAAISGSVVSVRTAFIAGENDDGFYSTTDLNDSPLPLSIINEPYAVRVRGASLLRVDGSPDKLAMAETYQELGFSIANRRFRNLIVDRITVPIGGLDQSIEGFYICAVRAGMIAGLPPQQPLTNYPMVGVKAVAGTNSYFSEKQLKIISAGGNDVISQTVLNGPVFSRQQLTTDMSSIESRECSINRVVDYTSKTLRQAIRNYIGRFNITQGFVETISQVAQGIIEYLIGRGVLAGGQLDELIQDASSPDGLAGEFSIDPPMPCNKIRLTLNI